MGKKYTDGVFTKHASIKYVSTKQKYDFIQWNLNNFTFSDWTGSKSISNDWEFLL